MRIEQSRTGKYQVASSKPRRARTRDAQHRLETKSEAGAHAAAGRVAVTAPETAGRALPRGERVAVAARPDSPLAARGTPSRRRVGDDYHNYS